MNEHRLTAQRSARYFTLGFADTAREVWFVLHGYGQLAARFLRACTVLEDGSRLIVAPEALNRFYVDEPAHQKVGATWMTREDRLADIADTVRYLDAVQTEVFRVTPRAGRRVHVLGFSQGAAAACRWAALGAVAPDRVILWGGEVPPDLDLAKLRVPVVFVHGRADEMITAKVAATNAARLRDHGIIHRLVPFDGGPAIDAEVLAAIAATEI